MAKKIKGYVDGEGDGPEFNPHKEGNRYFPFWEDQGITLSPTWTYWREATVVIHRKGEHEPVFTEREVRAMLQEISKGIYRGKIGEGPQHTIATIAAKHGVVLDRA